MEDVIRIPRRYMSQFFFSLKFPTFVSLKVPSGLKPASVGTKNSKSLHLDRERGGGGGKRKQEVRGDREERYY